MEEKTVIVLIDGSNEISAEVYRMADKMPVGTAMTYSDGETKSEYLIIAESP